MIIWFIWWLVQEGVKCGFWLSKGPTAATNLLVRIGMRLV